MVSGEGARARHLSEITAIAIEFGNSAKIIAPRSWLKRRVIAFLHSEYISKHAKKEELDKHNKEEHTDD